MRTQTVAGELLLFLIRVKIKWIIDCDYLQCLAGEVDNGPPKGNTTMIQLGTTDCDQQRIPNCQTLTC